MLLAFPAMRVPQMIAAWLTSAMIVSSSLVGCSDPTATCEAPAKDDCPAGSVPHVDWHPESEGSERDVCRGNTTNGACEDEYAEYFQCQLDNPSCLDEEGYRVTDRDALVQCSDLFDTWGECINETR